MENETSQSYRILGGQVSISCYVELEKNIIMNNEPINVFFCVDNLSDKSCGIFDGCDTRNFLGRSMSFNITMKNVETDEDSPDPYKNMHSFGGLGGYRTLSNHSEENVKWKYRKRLFLPHYVTLSKPGTYELTISKNVEFRCQSLGINSERNDITTNKSIITILPHDYETERKYLIDKSESFFLKTESKRTDGNEKYQIILKLECFQRLRNIRKLHHPFFLDFFIRIIIQKETHVLYTKSSHKNLVKLISSTIRREENLGILFMEKHEKDLLCILKDKKLSLRSRVEILIQIADVQML